MSAYNCHLLHEFINPDIMAFGCLKISLGCDQVLDCVDWLRISTLGSVSICTLDDYSNIFVE